MEEKIYKNILHIVGGMDVGGTETMLMNLYRKINNEVGFHFISYCEKDAYYDDEIRRLGGKVIKLQSPDKVGQIQSIINLYRLLKSEKYDIVHAHTLFNCGSVMLAAKLAGVKIRISHAHTNLELGASRIKKIYFYIMRKLIKYFSTDFLACSNSAGKYLFGDSIVNNKKYKVLPNYVDYKKIIKCNDVTSIRLELGFNEEDIIVGHIGRFVDAKNHKFLIEVLNKIIKQDNHFKAVLVGDGPLKSNIQKQIDDLGISNNVKLLGLRKDIDVILNNCNLFIFPSIHEGLGLVLLEAQAAGLPCLVSEAIQPEANLGIGLLNQLDLDEGVERWSSEALKIINKKNRNKEYIEKVFIEKGLELSSIIKTLLDVYKIKIN